MQYYHKRMRNAEMRNNKTNVEGGSHFSSHLVMPILNGLLYIFTFYVRNGCAGISYQI